MRIGVGPPMGMLLIAAAAASGAVFAQPEVAATDPQTQLGEQIAALRSEGGPTPVGLIEPLRALALLYEESGDHALAMVAIEEARYATRVHQGLSSVDEALLLRQQIRSAKALGDHGRVWELEQDMVTIARKHHDDLRTVPIFRELAEDRSDALEEYLGGEGYPPEIELGCYFSPALRRYDDTRGERQPRENGSCRSGSRDTLIRQFRTEILLYYADAIEVILRNGDYASPELRDLEKQALRVSFSRRSACQSEALDELLALPLLQSCLRPVIRVGDVAFANIGGWVSLVRLMAYELRSDAPAAARANAVAELADWLFLNTPPERFRHEQSDDAALELYELAYRDLEQGDGARASIFSPEVPVTLPTYAPNPFAFATTAESPRYIDVSFDIAKHGESERLEILDTSRGATRAEERDLIRLIESMRFRPRFVDGELADSAPVVLRYPLGR